MKKTLPQLYYIWKTRKFDEMLLRFYNALYNQNKVERWIKGRIPSFSEKDDLEIAKNYCGITLTSTVAKVFNMLLLNRNEPEIEKYLR